VDELRQAAALRIREITLQPFRNFDHIRLRFESDRTVIKGANGCGKSNILEAISYLSIGKSVRGNTDRQAVPHRGEFFDIHGLCNDGRRDHKLRVFYNHHSGKKGFLNDAPLPRLSDVIGVLRTVHFSPEDVSLVLRFPAQRRRNLDILLSQSSATYLHDLQQYRRVLTQRNHLLRASKRTATLPREPLLSVWNEQLGHFGARLRSRRLKALQHTAESFVGYYRRFSSGETVGIEYRGLRSKGDERDEGLKGELLSELVQKREVELQHGYTLCGPHRDDLVFTLDDHPADTFASEGQLKTILVSWKMAEVRFLEKHSGYQPVLLLDDVFSELDFRRIGKLLEVLDEFDQVVLTTSQELERSLWGKYEEVNFQA
jgi:DNA replication and repair protein RecF